MDVEGYGFNREFLKKHPELMGIVYEAINDEWTPDRFEARIKNTQWWQGKTESQRQWDLLSSTDPKQQQRIIQQNETAIKNLAGQMGVGLSPDQIKSMARNAGKNGLDQADLQELIAAKWKINTKKPLQGQAGATVDGLRQLAESYGIGMSRTSLAKATRKVLSGEATVEGFTDVLREQAKRLYSPVAEELDKGATVRDLLAPYQEAAARELGMAVTDMDVSNPKWTAALISKERNGSAMDMDEWTRTLRSDEKYGFDRTPQARQQAAKYATNLSRLFGAQA